MKTMKLLVLMVLLACVLAATVVAPIGCKKTQHANTLTAISPNNEYIQREFERAFADWHRQKYGEDVVIVWRDVGGGSNQILTFLRNHVQPGKSSDIDLLWGGGDTNFVALAKEGRLQKMELSQDVLDNVPETLGGQRLYGEDNTWMGTALSGFGFLYNKTLLEVKGVQPPATWDDLAKGDYYNMISLADPMQSGSVAVAYEMIVLSEDEWAGGWAKLLDVLGNGKKYFDSASASANAPLTGESAIAACIDFYGTMRVHESPDELVYVKPHKQTVWTPDAIAIVSGARRADLAQRFIEFVMTPQGQALWALDKGAQGGPTEMTLWRHPIRKDVYETKGKEFLPGITSPYADESDIRPEPEFRKALSSVLKRLVKAAAVDNQQQLAAARKRVIERNDPAVTAEFHALPDNVNSRSKLIAMAAILDGQDQAQIERVTSDWHRFFRDKYERIAQ